MSTVLVTKPKLATREEIVAIAGEYYVGYQRDATLETALGKVGKRFNRALGTNFDMNDFKQMTSDLNVVNCGGLENYMVELYRRMEQKA